MADTKKEKRAERLIEIPTRLIVTGDEPVRESFDEQELTRLANSIDRHGLLQPLKVKALGDAGRATVYELVSGRRRLRACKLLCIASVPCIVTECDETGALETVLCENLVRSDLNMFEQAEAISRLMRVSALSEKQTAERLSVSESFVENKLKLLSLQKHERQLVLHAGLEEGQALSLARLQSSEKRIRILSAIIEGHPCKAERDAYINGAFEERPKEDCESKQQIKAVLKDRRIFINTVERAVATLRSGGVNVEFEKSESASGDMVMTIRLAPY